MSPALAISLDGARATKASVAWQPAAKPSRVIQDHFGGQFDARQLETLAQLPPSPPASPEPDDTPEPTPRSTPSRLVEMPRSGGKIVRRHPDYDQDASPICLPYDDTGENALPARPARKRDRDEDIGVEPEEDERRASRMRAWQEMDRREDNKQTKQDTHKPIPVTSSNLSVPCKPPTPLSAPSSCKDGSEYVRRLKDEIRRLNEAQRRAGIDMQTKDQQIDKLDAEVKKEQQRVKSYRGDLGRLRKERSESEALIKSLRSGAALKRLYQSFKMVEADNDALYVQLEQAKREARAAREDAACFRSVNAALQGQLSELRLRMSGQGDGLVAGLVASDSGVESADVDADTATFGINTANAMPTDTTAVTSHISFDDREALAAARAQIARLEEMVKGYIGSVIEAVDEEVMLEEHVAEAQL